MAVRAERGPAALSPLRTVALVIGFVCAAAASVTIFLTDDAKYLRIGILVALWGFVFAALAAGRRQTEQAMAASAEVELRKSYEFELEREVTARREYELRLEAQLRRELQDDFAKQVGGLREEMVLLRRELSEQWDSELRVERMVMRTQSVRMGNDRREALEHDASPTGAASIDAAPTSATPPNSTSFEPGSAEPAYFEPSSGEPTYFEPSPPEPRTFESAPAEPAAWDAIPYEADNRTSDHDHDGPSTSEFPIVAGARPPLPTAPVPVRPPADAVVSPPKPPEPAAQYPAASDSDDVLTRVLAEAGASPGGRRRQHRYADEEEDAPAPF